MIPFDKSGPTTILAIGTIRTSLASMMDHQTRYGINADIDFTAVS